jgi:hypothetical protein
MVLHKQHSVQSLKTSDSALLHPGYGCLFSFHATLLITINFLLFAFIRVHLRFLLSLKPTLQTGFNKHIEATIEHGLGITGFNIGAQIFNA